MVHYTHQDQNTKDEYATKPGLWRPLAKAVGGFDVDPASGAENTPIADTCYTKETDGLQQEWAGNVWLNPPFSLKEQFYKKAVNEVSGGSADLVIALAPGGTSADWFQRWFSKANLLCWLDGRDWYICDGSPSFNTVVGVFGTPPDPVCDVLHRKGILTELTEPHTQQTL